MQKRACDSCGEQYEYTRPNSKFCRDTCRKRGARGAVRAPVVQINQRPRTVEDDGVMAATRRELRDADRLSTALGQSALILAERLERGGTDSAVASLNKEWRATLDAALDGSRAAASPIEGMRDELADRRARLA